MKQYERGSVTVARDIIRFYDTDGGAKGYYRLTGRQRGHYIAEGDWEVSDSEVVVMTVADVHAALLQYAREQQSSACNLLRFSCHTPN